MRLYVAGPMTGYPKFNYPAFYAAASILHDRGYDVLCPTDCGVPEGSSWETYMRATLTMMLRADGVALLPGWQESRGATLEVSIADQLSMPVKMAPLWREVKP